MLINYRNNIFFGGFNNLKFLRISCTAILIVLTCNGCKKFIEADVPALFTTADEAFASDANSIAVLNGIYVAMSEPGSETINHYLSIFAGLSADEFELSSLNTEQLKISHYRNELNSNTGVNVWPRTYSLILKINFAIEGLNSSAKLSPQVKSQLIGEAYFLRAIQYFYLVNLYGPVPLQVSSDYKINTQLSRESVANIYKQIVADLKIAEMQLSDHFVGPDGKSFSSERVVPNKWTAKAMLARVGLFMKDYNTALKYSSEVIEQSALFKLTSLDSVFLANSTEAIWQIQPISVGWNTEDAKRFKVFNTGLNVAGDGALYVSDRLLGAFESNDNRKLKWLNSVDVNGVTEYYPYKYKISEQYAPVKEYQMALRLSEQYLIRAEAKSHLDDQFGAIADLDVIRKRAGLHLYNGVDSREAVLKAILNERRVELFSEWGHRWLDLIRTENVDSVMGPVSIEKGGSWESHDRYYPILATELNVAPNLKQTQGY